MKTVSWSITTPLTTGIELLRMVNRAAGHRTKLFAASLLLAVSPEDPRASGRFISRIETFSIAEPVMPLYLAEIAVEPIPMPVADPFSLIPATAGVLADQADDKVT